MGLNLDNLVGNFDNTWIPLTKENLRQNEILMMLKIHTESQLDDFYKELKENRYYKVHGIIREIYPTVYFVYDYSLDKFNIFSIFNNNQRPYPLVGEDVQKLFAEIYSSDKEFIENHKEENCLICLNERELLVENVCFNPKYLLWNQRVYSDTQVSNRKKEKPKYSDLLFIYSNINLIINSAMLFVSSAKYSSLFSAFFIVSLSNWLFYFLFERKFSTKSQKVCLYLNGVYTLLTLISWPFPNIAAALSGVVILGSLYKFFLEKQEYKSKLNFASSRHSSLFENL